LAKTVEINFRNSFTDNSLSQMTINSDQWSKIVTSDETLQKFWTIELNGIIKTTIKHISCVFVFKYGHLKKSNSRKSIGNFFIAKMKCKHPGISYLVVFN